MHLCIELNWLVQFHKSVDLFDPTLKPDTPPKPSCANPVTRISRTLRKATNEQPFQLLAFLGVWGLGSKTRFGTFLRDSNILQLSLGIARALSGVAGSGGIEALYSGYVKYWDFEVASRSVKNTLNRPL